MEDKLEYISLNVNDSWEDIARKIGEGLSSQNLNATTLQEFLESEVVVEHKKKIEALDSVIQERQDAFYDSQEKLYNLKDNLDTQLETEIAKRTCLDLNTFYYYKADMPRHHYEDKFVLKVIEVAANSCTYVKWVARYDDSDYSAMMRVVSCSKRTLINELEKCIIISKEEARKRVFDMLRVSDLD